MKRILVIGDGQLGMMLAAAAARLGLALDRLAPGGERLYRGTGRSGEDLPPGWNGADYDIVTVEREHLPDSPLIARLREHPGFAAERAVRLLADRRSQKRLLDELGIATADWVLAESAQDIEALARACGSAVIVKAAEGGYDGRGQWRVDATTAGTVPAALHGQLIAERQVAFTRELSLVGARGRDGSCVFLPLVENVHRDGMLRTTIAPARVPPDFQRTAESMLRTLMDALDYTGTMAMELFEEDGNLLVNELAPRVHNSGHWSLDGATGDQFELHLRALCGWPLATPRTEGRRSVMLNLVGCDFDTRWLGLPGARLHWYGKERQPGRKLGHLTLGGANAGTLAAQLQACIATLDATHADAALNALVLLAREDATTSATATRYAAHPAARAAPLSARA